MFRLHGGPQFLVSNRFKLFTSTFFAKVSGLLGLKQHLLTAYHPQTGGQTERANRSFEDSQLSIMPRFTVSLIECSCDVRLHIAGRGDENLLDPKGATTVTFDDVHGTCTLVCSHLDSHLDEFTRQIRLPPGIQKDLLMRIPDKYIYADACRPFCGYSTPKEINIAVSYAQEECLRVPVTIVRVPQYGTPCRHFAKVLACVYRLSPVTVRQR